MLLAELEVYHSRPIAPTRRVALGALTLPCDPAPGVGGILLGAVAARFTPELDPELIPDLVSLTHDVEAGRRISQPRLRHRFQDDRIGLTRSPHRLFRHDDGELSVTFTSDKGLPGQMVLGAIYAASTVPCQPRGVVLAAIRRGIAWSNDIGSALLINLSGTGGAGLLHTDASTDPVGWALRTLGLHAVGARPERSVVQRSFRRSLIDVHPDHGGTHDDAARRIADITEARRILLAS